MAFSTQPGHSSQPQSSQQYEPFANYGNPSSSSFNQHPNPAPQFDIIDWYPKFQSCHRYFLDHAQHSGPVQALAAFINILLPYQKVPYPVLSSVSPPPPPAGRDNILLQPNQFGAVSNNTAHAQSVSLIPYIRRLIVTGHDTPPILHGFFGDDWIEGIGSLHEVERRNYLFAAKSQAWLKVKEAYDMSLEETCPFLMPLKDATEAELQAADSAWSEWLAMGDWMLGPRTPETLNRMTHSPHVKREPHD